MALPTDPNLPWPPQSVPQIDFSVWGEWYSGEFSPAGSEYSTVPVTTGGVTERLTGGFVHRHPSVQGGSTTNPRPGSQAVHCPLAGDIAQASADLLFSEMPNIRITEEVAKASEKRLTWLLDEMGAQNVFLEAAEPCAALGGTYLRVTWDRAFADYPFLTSVDADKAVPEFTWSGQLRAVTFWRKVAGKDPKAVYRHLERHEPGSILHGLYLGTKSKLGSSVGLDQSEETQGLSDTITLPEALRNGLVAFYVPNVRPNRRHRDSYLGIGGALATYIRQNKAAIVDYGARYRSGHRIASSLAESAVDTLVARRMVKKQQMQWSLKGAHRMLQVRAAVLELWRNFGDGVNQAADFFSAATSIPSRNVTPLTTFGN